MINRHFCEEFLQVACDFEKSRWPVSDLARLAFGACYADNELVVITPSGMQFSQLTRKI
jgi:hypothetical protein